MFSKIKLLIQTIGIITLCFQHHVVGTWSFDTKFNPIDRIYKRKGSHQSFELLEIHLPFLILLGTLFGQSYCSSNFRQNSLISCWDLSFSEVSAIRSFVIGFIVEARNISVELKYR